MRNPTLPAVLALLVAFVALPKSALACDPAPATPQAVVPLNGDRVAPSTPILVVGTGMSPAGADVTLKDRAGNSVALQEEVLERGLFQWLAIYQPKQALSANAYDFFASYPFQGGDPATIATSFQVQDTEAETFETPTIATWSTATFAPTYSGLCESYDNATKLTLDMPRRSAPPLWYEVELTREDESNSARFAIVPGTAEDDGAQVTREFHADFAVGCVRVTPVGQSGARGEAAESCEPQGCLMANPDEVDMATLWDDMPACDGSAPGQSGHSSSGSDSACSVARMPSAARSPWLAMLGVFVLLGFKKRQ